MLHSPALIHIQVYQTNLGHWCWSQPVFIHGAWVANSERGGDWNSWNTLTFPTVISPSYSQAENGKLSLYLPSLFGTFCFYVHSLLLLVLWLFLFCRVASSSFRVIAIHLTSSRLFLSWLPQRERESLYVRTNTAGFPLAWCVEAGNDGEAYYVCLDDVNENVCRRSCNPLGKNVKYVKWKITFIT